MPELTAEAIRLAEDAKREKNWKRWGPYLADRQWGTVREDYSADGSCWTYFPHDHARSRAYRWGEDGLLGFTDRECRLCFSIALWNGVDPILKERLFGLTGPEGNHGEDVKECYYFLDSSPTHSYCKALYKYPQRAFPYAQLVETNRARTRAEPEYELTDTGVFEESRYFDVFVEYAKASPNDVLVKVTVHNRGPESAAIHLLPTAWFRNTWTWSDGAARPAIRQVSPTSWELDHATLGTWFCEFDETNANTPATHLFTENETNAERVFNAKSVSPFVKDAFHRRVVNGDEAAVNPVPSGTKAAAWYRLDVPAGESREIRVRLYAAEEKPRVAFGKSFDDVFKTRVAECDAFYETVLPSGATEDEKNVSRQSYAGLLWSKQYFGYDVYAWLHGDANQPKPPRERLTGRNADWKHVFCRDVLSMPDKWEYPWFAAWDLAFHMLPMARVDPAFAKEQLILLLREWYTHPNGQLPAYEFAFGDVNPPVHAWAVWRVYKLTGKRGERDYNFLARCFQKLMINFTWWVNRKDAEGKHIFGGGFLGLDNIGVFDRSKPLPDGGTLEQADGTAWMAFYCGTMLSMALELAKHDPVYEDVASKFFEHFVEITHAINTLGGKGLWDNEDGFYYDQLQVDGVSTPMKIRSLVGIIPLFACEILEHDTVVHLKGFAKRMRWFLDNVTDLAKHVHPAEASARDGKPQRLMMAIPSKERLTSVLKYVLDENEFLSDFGIRSLSRVHHDRPFEMTTKGGEQLTVKYSPAESETSLFGGNSNWRGPIWFPTNYLLIEALERYAHFYGDEFKVECPTGSGVMMTLDEVSSELQRRLSKLFLPDAAGRRAAFANNDLHTTDPHWRNLVLFYEYFHGDTGRGLGATHQTGWTALVSRCLEDVAWHRDDTTSKKKTPRRVGA